VETHVSRGGSVECTALSRVPADAFEVGEDLLVGIKSFLTERFVYLIPDFLALDDSKADLNSVHDVQEAPLLLPKQAADHSVV
jgi:hypothetical protein